MPKMISELLTFTKDRLATLKDEYAIAVASSELQFQFDGHDFLVDYTKNLFEDLEDHFKRAKQTKPIYRFCGNS